MTASARPERSGPRSADGQVVGALLVVAGVAWLLQRSGLASMSWETLLSALLVLLGFGLVITARRAGGSGLIVIGIVLTAVLASNSSLDIGLLKEGVGDRAIQPDTVARARQDSSLGIGSLHVDLTEVVANLPDGKTTLDYSVAIGELNVVLPRADAAPDVKVKVIADVNGGDLDLLGLNRSGQDIKETYTEEGFTEAPKQLVIRVSTVFGNVQVDRAPF